MRLGSLFDGSGAAPLAAALLGIEPVWASEVEPFCVRVTEKRFPGMRHCGCITKIDGAALEPVDIIVGGSPCQDLSAAGMRAGLNEGKRSSLFYEMIRVIREMREATDGKYPRYVVWENVPGAFSSSGGEDFKRVLEEYCRIAQPGVSIPRPQKWEGAGFIRGDGYSLAGERSTRNTSQFPNAARECSLYSILLANVPIRYYLSAAACRGILNRAARRGKALPEMLREALEQAANA